ncbi:hypothetical protein [Verminephrobacter aporrectodeae]|uniref:Uncharacterized protein n=1 Tax=Verminephrobacter aporrectodeae subsp. tuberculatae TaxID=1110392 RepID=A0ABT3KMY4_9BURK|nr:hypothetical protein [Verminephrobacter aporrectodeae]MCW5221091.1 hypothetical protein [Verminephrobacter aporrectodeae subsp. tuberculatae]MCW5254846.1 hypothetical protein [Verminephrobacter aporrectodeae subsp. tuberculatae]MCW5290384.1 hypothetical protein [Verminephrobacter aporrectodeae subsp. tuberculatae]MCW5319686.1 hypothetical protein [Verminephrobacter aporrectodeae subsp. tuberculatae]MCW8164936.1 hypothetical protein [Verminephrobacter aporrectodeae subsp. tuberculatae]
MPALPCAAAVLAAALFGPLAIASCYVVYGPDKEVVYRASEPPVDMSRPLHETLPRVAPGAALVFSPDDHNCTSTMNKLPLAALPEPATAHMRPARTQPTQRGCRGQGGCAPGPQGTGG